MTNAPVRRAHGAAAVSLIRVDARTEWLTWSPARDVRLNEPSAGVPCGQPASSGLGRVQCKGGCPGRPNRQRWRHRGAGRRGPSWPFLSLEGSVAGTAGAGNGMRCRYRRAVRHALPATGARARPTDTGNAGMGWGTAGRGHRGTFQIVKTFRRIRGRIQGVVATRSCSRSLASISRGVW